MLQQTVLGPEIQKNFFDLMVFSFGTGPQKILPITLKSAPTYLLIKFFKGCTKCATQAIFWNITHKNIANRQQCAHFRKLQKTIIAPPYGTVSSGHIVSYNHIYSKKHILSHYLCFNFDYVINAFFYMQEHSFLFPSSFLCRAICLSGIRQYRTFRLECNVFAWKNWSTYCSVIFHSILQQLPLKILVF